MSARVTPEEFEEERIRVRDLVLRRASDALGEALEESAKHIPARDLAAFIAGNESRVHQVVVSERTRIVRLLRTPRYASVSGLADLLEREPTKPGFLRCVFMIGLRDGSIDVSIVAVRDERVS